MTLQQKGDMGMLIIKRDFHSKHTHRTPPKVQDQTKMLCICISNTSKELHLGNRSLLEVDHSVMCLCGTRRCIECRDLKRKIK